MQVDIYKIHHSKWGYIIVPANSNIKSIIASLSGFYESSFTTYRRVRGPHDTYSPNSALNSDAVRDDLKKNGYRFAFRIRKP